MRQKDVAVLVGIGLLAAIISSFISGAVFSPSKVKTQAPQVTPITSTFPDVYNDSEYKAFLNSNAIDPTQLIKVGASKNQQPFTNSTQ